MILKLVFGAIVPNIGQQLRDAGFTASKNGDIEHWQKDADAITRLIVRGLLTDSAGTVARRKLMKKITAGVGRGEAP